MSVEKLCDESQSYLEENPYAQIFNEIIYRIKDNDAFRVYCYLAAKPRSWKVIKEFALKECGVGQRKGKQIFSYLFRCGLLRYCSNRKQNGQFHGNDILVSNGKNFNPLITFEPTGADPAPVDTAGALTAHAENGTCGNVTTIKKEIINKEKEERERNTLTDEQFKTNEMLALCREKNILFSLELKKFRSHYKGREVHLGLFENWIRNARTEKSKPMNESGYASTQGQSTSYKPTECQNRSPMPDSMREFYKKRKRA